MRAMFENKNGDQSTSPPSRGRSPSASVASSSSRPVSKVRASFVAVERSGEQGQSWGLRKASDVSSMADVIKENETSVVDGPPLVASTVTPEKDTSGGLGSILKGSSFAGTPSKESSNKLEAVAEKKDNAPIQAAEPKTNGIGARAAEAAKKIQDKAKTSSAKSAAEQAAKPTPNHIETKVAGTQSTAKSPRTPTSAGMKPRGGVAKVQGVMESAKRAAEGREATKKAETAKTPTTPKSPAKVNGTKEPQRSPRKPVVPKSPAKTTRGPSAATAPTAASAAHIRSNPEPPTKKPSMSSKSGKLPSAVTATTAASSAHGRAAVEPQAKKPAVRRASAVHSSRPRLSTTGTQASLAKKASRASLADRPKSRTSMSKPDAGFLERMMRPTQSSAQKTHEKTQVSSPPRQKHAPAHLKPPPRTSMTGRAHHDHADVKGDYAQPTPRSPITTKQITTPTTPSPTLKRDTTAAGAKNLTNVTDTNSAAPVIKALPLPPEGQGPAPVDAAKELPDPAPSQDVAPAATESLAGEQKQSPAATQSSLPQDVKGEAISLVPEEQPLAVTENAEVEHASEVETAAAV